MGRPVEIAWIRRSIQAESTSSTSFSAGHKESNLFKNNVYYLFQGDFLEPEAPDAMWAQA